MWTVGYRTGNLAGAGGKEQLGILIGPKDVIYQSRTYSGTVTQCEVRLYEDTFNGGVAVPAANRNLRISQPGPVSYFSGVTGTPTTLRTGLNLYAAGVGNGSLGNLPEGEWYMLKANTQYILVLINTGSSPGVVDFRYTYRAVS